MDTNTASLLGQIFQTVFPLFAIVTLGFFYARKHNPDFSVPNKLNIDIFVPALIFSVMSAKTFELETFQNLALAAAVVVIGSGLLLWPVARMLGVNTKTFLPPMMFSNSGNLGLPLAVLAFGEHALPAAVVLFLVENTLHFTLGVYMLQPRASITKMLTTPIMLASFAGIIWSISDFHMPKAVGTFIEMLGQISIPLMLFALGVRITSVDFSRWKIGFSGALLCPLSGILLALLISLFVPLPPEQFAYLVLFGALPPALLNFMLAEKFNQEPDEVASIVLLGNIGSLIFIPVTLYFVL